jgi:quercetin dioxygenase-like cupin family protein
VALRPMGTRITLYYTLIGPGINEAGGVHAENIFCASYYLQPGKLYPAHNHPSRKFYYVMGGEAIFYSGDQEIKASKGSFIMHPPYTSHAILNISETELFEALTCWWSEPGDPEDPFAKGGLMTNPCLVQHAHTANPKRIALSNCDESKEAAK